MMPGSIQRMVVLWTGVIILLLLAGCSHKDNQQDAEQQLVRAAALMKESDYLSALPLLDNAIDLLTEVKSDSAAAEACLLAGECHRNLGHYDSAFICYRHAV